MIGGCQHRRYTHVVCYFDGVTPSVVAQCDLCGAPLYDENAVEIEPDVLPRIDKPALRKYYATLQAEIKRYERILADIESGKIIVS